MGAASQPPTHPKNKTPTLNPPTPDPYPPRANILNSEFTQMGAATAVSAVNGKTYWTQVGKGVLLRI